MATTASTLLTAPIRAPFPTKINTKIFLNSIKMSPSPSSSSSMMMMMMMSSLNTKTTTTTSSNRIIAASTSQSTSLGFGEENNSRSQQQLAVLLEVEGVLMDVYRLVNRESFNLAFRKLGLDCANWTEPIYWDLMRKAGGDEKIMLVLFFNRIGWPTSLPTSEKETFMKSVLLEKRRAFDEYVMTKDIPLRPGVEDFIDDALNEGLPVIALTAYSKHGDKVARWLIWIPRACNMTLID
ncbi:hypothetical protein GIB67_015489 [Kingdonia uniflora]|uniref:Uncharacterized protein n=1 Tax=Kingdonia uniflora TaxID=39325 RepID=A0A7J7LAD5_9MAGN|nr:hypothetical protein GIB67_015489 [Kingdonia uniflora]